MQRYNYKAQHGQKLKNHQTPSRVMISAKNRPNIFKIWGIKRRQPQGRLAVSPPTCESWYWPVLPFVALQKAGNTFSKFNTSKGWNLRCNSRTTWRILSQYRNLKYIGVIFFSHLRLVLPTINVGKHNKRTLPPFSTFSSVRQLLTDAFAFSNKYVSPFFSEDTGMLCFLVSRGWIPTGVMRAREAPTCQGSRSCIKCELRRRITAQQWELLTFNHEEWPRGAYVKPRAGRLVAIYLKPLWQAQIQRRLFPASTCLSGLNLPDGGWFCTLCTIHCGGSGV